MRYIAILALSLAGAGPALAGSYTPAPPAAPVAAPAPSPLAANGNWGGLYAGVQLGFGGFDTSGAGINISDDGFLGGVHAGYNWDLGPYVVGVEADVDLADINLGIGSDVDTIARFKVRAGPDLGRTFVYATGGLAYAEGNIAGPSFSEWGYVVGGGIDYQYTDRWVIGGDVLYQRFNSVHPSRTDLDGTTARLRVSLRF